MMELLNISFPWQIQAQEETAIISWRECSKKSVQQGRSHFDARSVHGVREHGKMARTPLAAFFNIPIRKKGLRELALRPIGLFNEICIETLEPEKRREELDDANP
jgi:hypothetical protein